MLARLFGIRSSSKGRGAGDPAPPTAASSDAPRADAPRPSPTPPASAPAHAPPDAALAALASDPPASARHLALHVVPELELGAPRAVPPLERDAVRARLAARCNDASDALGRELGVRALAALARDPANAELVLATLASLDAAFERAFEAEETYGSGVGPNASRGAARQKSRARSRTDASSPRVAAAADAPAPPRPLRVFLLTALLRALGRQFSAFDLMEMSRDRADVAVEACLDLLDHATAATTFTRSPPRVVASKKKKTVARPDAAPLAPLDPHHPCDDSLALAALATRLLRDVAAPDAHFPEGESREKMAVLARRFKARCSAALAATLERDALGRLATALERLDYRDDDSSARPTADGAVRDDALEDGGGGEENNKALREENALLASANAVRFLRLVMLYSDENAAKFRKALHAAEFMTRVVEPFLRRAVADAKETDADAEAEAEAEARGQQTGGGAETRGGAENEGVDEKQKRLHRAIRRVVDALAALVAATHKNGAHRARLFAPGVFAPGSDDPPGDHAAAAASSLPGVLSSSPALASSLAVADALCRLSCNLGAGVGDDGGGERASQGRAAWREALEARLSRLVAAEAKRLARRFAAEERCAPTARDGATHAWLAGMLPDASADDANRREGEDDDDDGPGDDNADAPGDDTSSRGARRRERRRKARRGKAEARRADADARKALAAEEGCAKGGGNDGTTRSAPRVVAADAAVVVRVGARRAEAAARDCSSDDGSGSDGSSIVDRAEGGRRCPTKGGRRCPTNAARPTNTARPTMNAARPTNARPTASDERAEGDPLEAVDALLEEIRRLGL